MGLMIIFVTGYSTCDAPILKVHNSRAMQAAMAEWLRREIRNLLGSPRAGSNPVRSGYFSIKIKKMC